MKAEILCVGTELLLGDIINTNAAYIARELAAIGIDVYYQTVVGDNDGRLKDSLTLAFSRADVVVMTGGLGPTYDDLTKETVAEYFHKEMVMDTASLGSIEGFFKRLKRPMTENNRKQAMMPEGRLFFRTATERRPDSRFRKMERRRSCSPDRLRRCSRCSRARCFLYLMGFSDKVLISHNIRVFGMGESRVEDALHDLMKNSTNPTIAPYAKEGEVTLRVTASADTKEKCEEMIAPVIGRIREVLGQYIYGIDVPNLQTAAVTELIKKKVTVATAESCTGGLVSERITQVPGASEIFGCGICSYANEIKHRVLGVSKETLAKHGAVSEQTAEEMARGVRKLSGPILAFPLRESRGPEAERLKNR